MSKSNPTKAINALLPQPIKCGGGVEVLALSLGHYALLEKVDSPILKGKGTATDILDMIPSLYICTHNAPEVFADFDNLPKLVLDWAATLQPCVYGEIMAAITTQINVMMDVIPSPDDTKKKVVTTGGFWQWLIMRLQRLVQRITRH